MREPEWARLESETLQHFQDILRLDTSNPPGNESAVVDYLATVFTKEGIPFQTFALDPKRANLVARLKGTGKKRPVLIMGHTDVVTVDAKKWTFPPFSATRDGGYIYGRGSLDDKPHVVAGLMTLLDVERPEVVQIVSWAASNGDRSENGDYLYGKKRLREIDRRIRFLTQRLDIAEVADPSVHHGSDQIFFGATVTFADARGEQRCITIKGVDEADALAGEVSWVAPIARALLKAREGDEVSLATPGGIEQIEVLRVEYPAPGR